MEALAKQGFCTKQSPTPIGRVRFKINTYGIKYIQACWALNYLKLSTQRERLEKTILYVERRATSLKSRDRRLAKKVLKEVASLRLRVLELRETYGDILERSWFDETVYLLDTLSQRACEFLSAQKARTLQLPQFG